MRQRSAAEPSLDRCMARCVGHTPCIEVCLRYTIISLEPPVISAPPQSRGIYAVLFVLQTYLYSTASTFKTPRSRFAMRSPFTGLNRGIRSRLPSHARILLESWSLFGRVCDCLVRQKWLRRRCLRREQCSDIGEMRNTSQM
jgi:hypothetical protein